MKYHLRNTTDIANARSIIRFILNELAPLPVFDVQLKNSQTRGMAGRAYWCGSSYHDSARPFIVCRIGPWCAKPRQIRTYQYAHLKDKRYWTANKEEAFVYIASHEIRHLWQHRYPNSGRYPNSRGKFSEVDTDSFAIRMLRLWRNRV